MTREASLCDIGPTKAGPYLLVWICLLSAFAGCQANVNLKAVQEQQSRPTQRADLLQAAAEENGTIVTVGAMGVVITSNDGGTNWQRNTIPGKPFFIDVSVCPNGEFHAIDNVDRLWSRQSDHSWSSKPLPEGTEPQALTCDYSDTLWVVGGFATILSSRDAGTHWNSFSLDDDIYLTTVQFVDNENGFVTGEFGTVLNTTNSGSSWQLATALPDSFYPQAALFIDSANGWVVGLNGTIWNTRDGAQTWQQESSGSAAPLYGINTIGDLVIAVGDNATVLYRSAADQSWSKLESTVGTRTYLRAIIGVNERQFITAGGVLFSGTLPGN